MQLIYIPKNTRIIDFLPPSPALQHDLVKLLICIRWLLHSISIVQLVEQLLIGIDAGIGNLG